MSGWGPRVYKPTAGSATDINGIQIPGNTSAADPSFAVYNEVSSVAYGVQTDIFTYVVPASPIIHILRFQFGGTNIGQYKLYFGNIVQDQFITWFNGTGLTGEWNYETMGGGGLAVPSGTIVKVKVIHYRPDLADYYCRLSGVEIN